MDEIWMWIYVYMNSDMRASSSPAANHGFDSRTQYGMRNVNKATHAFSSANSDLVN